MSDVKMPGDSNFDDASSRLNEGLKSCRALVSNYRTLLAEQNSNAAQEQEISGQCDERGGESIEG